VRAAADSRPVLITGGAGFIGSNLCDRLATAGHRVRILDNLSRSGAKGNLEWLRQRHAHRIELVLGDVRDRGAVRAATGDVAAAFHLAAQVAVTTSLEEPQDDFSVNAQGTLELLEALRQQPSPPPLLYTSTNKVYGCLGDVELTENERRWSPADERLARRGVGEDRPLQFRSPYGCSKGAADQYVLDYAETFGLRTVVFRMSCIYGPHQHGTEEQGWVAHFLLRALQTQPLTIFGDGKQVRDVLYIDDLVSAFVLAWKGIDNLAGRAFNIGGGPAGTLSLLELLDAIETFHGSRPVVSFDAWRPGDQRYYVSDTSAFRRATGWRPRVPVAEGVRRLNDWLREQHSQRAWLEPLNAGSAHG
jgi:CDP-paratose 2-epimerase